MAWVKLDDGFAEHPKVLSVSVQARWAYVSALCYTSRRLTDGVIPRAVLPSLTITQKIADELVNAKLWDRHGNDYMVHDYLEYNMTKAEIEESRARRTAAGKVGGTKSGQARRSKTEANASPIVQDSLPNRSDNDEAKPNPIPIPIRNTSVSTALASQDEDTHTSEPEIPVAIREMRDTILSCLPPNYRYDSASMGEAQQLAEDFAGSPSLITDAIAALRSRGERVWPNAIRKQISPPKPKTPLAVGFFPPEMGPAFMQELNR